MQDRVKRASADSVTVASELFSNREAENRLPDSVMKDMQANQAGIKIAVVHGSITNIDSDTPQRYRIILI